MLHLCKNSFAGSGSPMWVAIASLYFVALMFNLQQVMTCWPFIILLLSLWFIKLGDVQITWLLRAEGCTYSGSLAEHAGTAAYLSLRISGNNAGVGYKVCNF